ncbi:hypothetical protein ACM1TL_05430 [Lysinibacillus capsici]|uniref:hypothetical protein n=1 Tax=Lysinibacillus capsici TaxID=2115968 RepID=UPI0039FCB57C
MSKLDKLIDTFIEATEEKRMKWSEANSNNLIKQSIEGNSSYGVLRVDTTDLEDVYIIKYTTNTNSSATLEKTLTGDIEKYKSVDKVKLIICNIAKMQIITEIEETDIGNPHRLWTLFKLADRNAKGADVVIDNLIDKYSKYPF